LGDISRGLRLLSDFDSSNLLQDCAAILEKLKQYPEAASLLEKGQKWNQAAAMWVKGKGLFI
jgi:hypothetical protein